MALITYQNKVTMNENPNISAVNKVQASDMNEIKNVVNTNWNSKQILTATLTSDVTMGTSVNYTNVNFNNIACQTTNSELVLATGSTSSLGSFKGIQIPAGVSKIKINANMQFTNTSGNSMYFVHYIYKYSGGSANIIARSITLSYSATNASVSAVVPTFLIDVNEGDIIWIRGYKSVSANSANIMSGTSRTFLTVETVE